MYVSDTWKCESFSFIFTRPPKVSKKKQTNKQTDRHVVGLLPCAGVIALCCAVLLCCARGAAVDTYRTLVQRKNEKNG